MVSYEGLFFNKESVELIHSLEYNRLTLVNNEIHCTFKYRPAEEELFDEIVGKTFKV